jgi:hypothetical protein
MKNHINKFALVVVAAAVFNLYKIFDAFVAIFVAIFVIQIYTLISSCMGPQKN